MSCRQFLQKLDEPLAALRVRSEQGLVEQERCALTRTAEHLAQRETEQQGDLVAGAVRHGIERHHVRPFATEQRQREVVGVDVDLDIPRRGEQAQPACQGTTRGAGRARDG